MGEKITALRHVLLAKRSRKNLILSVVAVIEVIAILAVISFAWVENISAIKISGSGVFEDELYTTANIGTGAGYQSSVDLSRFFRASGGIHLGSASSANGRNMFFPITQTADTGLYPYRKATVNDNNVNYYNYSIKVKAVTSKCDFFFQDVPAISINSTPVPEYTDSDTKEEKASKSRLRNAVRLAITVDGETKVFTLDGVSEDVVSSLGGLKSHVTTDSFQSYISGLTTSKKLFSVDLGQTKTVGITLWLQDTVRDGIFAGKTVSMDNLVLAAGRSSVYFRDYTSKFNVQGQTTWQWASDTDHPLFVYDGSKCYSMSRTIIENEWSAQILTSVLEDTSKTLYFCRCAPGTESINSQNDGNVLQYWAASIASRNGSTIYKAYGSVANRGTWGDVVQITVGSDDTDLATPGTGSEHTATHITVVSNASSSVSSEMNYHINGDDEGEWRAYLPSASAESVSFNLANNNVTSTINAGARGASTSFKVTSATTGYWAPPATVTVDYAAGYDSDWGTISVSGGKSGATSVNVTSSTTVDLSAVAEEGYRFVGWCANADGSGTVITNNPYTVTAPAENEEDTYYAIFVRRYTVNFNLITDNDGEDTAGGTIKIDNGTEGSEVSAVVDDNSTVTLTATAAEGFTLQGIYEVDGLTETALSGNTATITANTEFVAKFVSVPAPSDYYLKGEFNNWLNDTDNPLSSGQMYYLNNKPSTKKVYKTIYLAAGTYEFKVHNYSSSPSVDVWYSRDDHEFTDSTSNSDFKDQNKKNSKITASANGYYTFVFDVGLSGNEKISIFYQRAEAQPADRKLSDVLVFNTSTEAKALWLWQNADSSNNIQKIDGRAYNTTEHSASGENTITTYNIGSEFVKPSAIGLNNTVSSTTNFPDASYKMTGDINCSSSVGSYPDRVFYIDNVSDTEWETFTHIKGTPSLSVSKPRTSNIITLSATTDEGTLKKSETYTYYIKKGTDVYCVGSKNGSTVKWMPLESGTYQVVVMVRDKWGIEKIASDPVTVEVK